MNPKWYQIGIGELGVSETSGVGNNNRISKEYFGATGLGPSPDSTPWCGAFEAWCMQQAGIPYRPGAARALDWLDWGKSVKKLKEIPIGAIGVIPRGKPGQGHVFQFAGWVDGTNRTKFHALEGNANTVYKDDKVVGKSDGIVQIGMHSTADVIDWRWPAGVPLPIDAQPVSTAGIIKTASVIAAGGATEIAANSGEIIDAVQKAKSISQNSIIGAVVGALIVGAVIIVILLRIKQKQDSKLIQENPGLKADKPANQ
jgi:uncharacterized protein (TIGR02594 family)